jgi:hypothetical protein
MGAELVVMARGYVGVLCYDAMRSTFPGSRCL